MFPTPIGAVPAPAPRKDRRALTADHARVAPPRRRPPVARRCARCRATPARSARARPTPAPHTDQRALRAARASSLKALDPHRPIREADIKPRNYLGRRTLSGIDSFPPARAIGNLIDYIRSCSGGGQCRLSRMSPIITRMATWQLRSAAGSSLLAKRSTP